MRIGSIQAAYVLGALGLGLVAPHIPVGLTVESSRVTEMLIAVGAAFVPFPGITHSLPSSLCSSARRQFTPRLNLFRDSAILWHGFSYYTAVIVFAFTAACSVGKAEQTTALIPTLVMVMVVARLTEAG